MKIPKIRITKWFYITFGAIFILYSAMMVWGITGDFMDDISFWERAKSTFMFVIVDDILYKVIFALAFAVIANFLALFIRKSKKAV
jgi:hypothetical protein